MIAVADGAFSDEIRSKQQQRTYLTMIKIIGLKSAVYRASIIHCYFGGYHVGQSMLVLLAF
ncbi:hypothetical protein [Vibrio sp. NH-UV-68]|uniref:hypothetical protein n=1 Tax=unclassified Vibrio TaxID=2614977 RepID=UPI0036F43B7D